MEQIGIWAGLLEGQPHWFHWGENGLLVRLCDGEVFEKSAEHRDQDVAFCPVCTDLYVTDSLDKFYRFALQEPTAPSF